MRVRDWIDEEFDSVVVADGFDDALIGVASGCGRGDIAIYDYAKCVEVLSKGGDNMTEDEAEEYIEFNVTGAFVGHDGPLFVRRPPDYYMDAELVDEVEVKETKNAARSRAAGVPKRKTVRARKVNSPGRK